MGNKIEEGLHMNFMKKISRQRFLAALMLGCGLAVLPCAGGVAQAASEAAVQQDLVKMPPTYRDVVLDTVKDRNGNDRTLRMNVFLPPAKGKAVPALVYVHGGGWARGDYAGNDKVMPKAEDGSNQMVSDYNATYDVFKGVLNDGIAFISVDYRLNSEDVFPAPLHDVKGAIRYVRAHAAEYGIDPERIAIAGSSAGAHLAAEAALTSGEPELEGTVGGNLDQSSAVMACVDYYGPTDLLTMAPEMNPEFQSPEEAAETHDSIRANESLLIGATGGAGGNGVGELRRVSQEGDTSSPLWPQVLLARDASPINHVTKNAPPFFIAHGGHDSLVPIAQSLRLQEALTKAGVENIFICNSKAPHGFQGDDVNAAMRAWLKHKLCG